MLVKQSISWGLQSCLLLLSEGDSRLVFCWIDLKINLKDEPLIPGTGYVQSKATMIIFKGSLGEAEG